MGDVDWSALGEALVRVERLGAADSGMLAFGAARLGGIFVEGGRVCWVAANGLQRRLHDLLRGLAKIPEADLDRVYDRCRTEGRVLGQTLVEEGLLQAHELEAVLRRHSAECLVDLCRSHQPTLWSPRAGRGYAPRFTFRALDLMFDVAGLFVPDAQSAARDELAAFAAPGRRGAAFLLDPALDMVVPIAELGLGMSVESLCALGRWARALPLASRELGTAPMFTLATTARGDTLAVWWHDSVLFAVPCEDRASVAEVAGIHLAST